MSLRKGDIVIDDSFTDTDYLFRYAPDGDPRARGAVPRNFSIQPPSTFAPPSGITLIPQSEWSARIKELVSTNSLISDMRLSMNNGSYMPSLDQGQVGYCWAHSTTHNVMLVRGLRNMKYVPLSAYSIAAIIKNGRDEGGWGGLSAEFAGKTGIAPQSIWPQGQRNVKQYDTEATRKIMAMYQTTEDWMDLATPAYDRNLTFDQLISLLLTGNPVVVDFNWWGHSVCAIDAVEVEPGSFGIRILNSWGDSWGEKGTGVLRGSKAKPDGAVCIRDAKTGEMVAA